MMRLFLLLLLISSCSKKKEILPPEKMQAVMWEYIRADIYVNEFLKKDSSVNAEKEHAAILKKIFTKYQISKETFFENYQYYTSRSELVNPLLDTIFARQTKRNEIQINKIRR